MTAPSPSAKGPSAIDRPVRLSETDAEMLMVYVAELSAANLPLASGLRAAAEEGGGRLAVALRSLADALDQGQSLNEALLAPASGFPRYLQGLVQAALRTGQLGAALTELVAHRRAAREQQRTVTSALAYPAMLLGFTGVMFLALAALLGPALVDMLDDFQLTVPMVSHVLIWIGQHGIAPILTALAGVLALVGVYRLIAGRAEWDRAVGAVPLFGPMWRWAAVAEMARLMASLVGRGVPLPEALQLTSAGLRDAHLAVICQDLAQGVEQGRELASLVVVSPRLPASLAPIIRWGQKTGQLDEAFASAADMFEGRVRSRAGLLRAVAPPFVLLIAAVFALAIFLGFVVPLVTLIQMLA